MTIYISENIKRLRLEKGITQEALAEHLGVTFQSVSRWERAEGYPDITLLPAIASFFGVTVDDLLGVSKVQNEENISKYIELYDTMKLKDLTLTFNEYKKAVREFPGDFRIAVRYMHLLHEAGIRTLSIDEILAGAYKKPSQELSKIYDSIQKHCTQDSIRIWAKTIMISHLMWKYDCICNEEGKYCVYKEYLNQADEIVKSLPSMRNSKEVMALDRENYYETHKNTIEELLFLLHEELYGYCLHRTANERITQFECLQALLKLIYTDGNFGKNSYHRLYNLGHLGHLYHQSGDDEKALKHLRAAAEYAKELDSTPDTSERSKRFYNYGTAYRELNASQFMEAAMTQHYPLSHEFKEKEAFREIINMLNKK